MNFWKYKPVPKYPRVAAVRIHSLFTLCIGVPIAGLLLDEQIPSQLGFVLMILSVACLFYAMHIARKYSANAIKNQLRLCDRCAQPFASETQCARCGNQLDLKKIDARWRCLILKFHPRQYRHNLGPIKRLFRPVYFVAPLILLPLAAMMMMNQPAVSAQPPAAGGVNMTAVAVFAMSYPFILFLCSFTLISATKKCRKLCDTAKRNNLCICENCLYPVDSSERAGICPECGTAYTTHDLRRRWYMAWGSMNIDKAIHMKVPLSLEEPETT